MRDWPRPRHNHEVRNFLGWCTYYKRFVNGFADIATPLHRLTNLKSQFKRVKNALCFSPILFYPQSSGILILDRERLEQHRNRCCIATGPKQLGKIHRVFQQRTFEIQEELLCYEEGVVGDYQSC
ncbi:hypothetical protein Zmor_026742 [Zophobas morio]|uniref:Uncharacterized protein n=1 Tax=Zophobas morio TaxID=2755281 RepID=A0AA38HZQ2_9CUCU|nr:hypothetical protein Zmor_026742 [Zophobas morio]